jgi:anti-sigma-K factor RskA
MTKHLSPAEYVDALDGELTRARQTHLDECAACRLSVAELTDVLTQTQQSVEHDVPEPSPLFWQHFEQRVGVAIAEETMAASSTGWWHRLSDFRRAPALAAAAVVIAMVALVPLALNMNRVESPVATPTASAEAEPGAMAETVEWQFVASVLGTLEEDTAREVLGPSPVALGAALESLTIAEREAFARLLEAEMSAGSE